MSDDFSVSDKEKEVYDDNSLYCKECGTLIEPIAVKESVEGHDVWQLWKKCPKANPENPGHSQLLLTDKTQVIVQKIINPDSINDVTDDNFTQQEINSLINNTLYQRQYLPCNKCNKKTIQIRYQRQTSTMKFYSICVQCQTAVDLASIMK
ncbi:Conserved_hypothetical protein [Hexamita inflata]|uniref:Uncharacterized protein n=1 Tax=Hexamita inflata TaxID=28002 RepID=A0AA86QVA3_9EUKA|nr:Conserved hypothetical protein [Hexamita inflata]CAI9958220.1 Conserved hypothetical protein [Hexamita inflata]